MSGRSLGLARLTMPLRENHYVVKTLKEFVHIDDQGKDQGINGQWECAASIARAADTMLQFDRRPRISRPC